MKSSSAGPDCVRMSRFSAATEAWFFSISSATMAGSVATWASALPAVAPADVAALDGSSWSDRMKPPRARTFSSASLNSGSAFPMTARRLARLAGEASRRVTSTNSRPPASRMGARVVILKKESPRGFIASVIIC